jgi:hypothetical protein
MADGSNHPRPLSLTGWDVLSLREAARFANVSDATVVRWARRFGIGRQFAPGQPWRISGPGLRMICACDRDALEAFRSLQLDDPQVQTYLLDGGRARA